MSNHPPEHKIELWRAKAQAGTMTTEETKEMVSFLRDRRAALGAVVGGSRVAKPKAGKVKLDANALLEGFL